MEKTKYFNKIFKKAQKKYEKSKVVLAGECWNEPWQTLIATIMSAQSRDETTIPIAKNLFKKYPTLNSLAKANLADVLKIFKSLNYNNTKAKNVINATKYLIKKYNKKVPKTLEELIKIPGVGRKTANLILGECFNLPSICVDTHVHRISNVFEFVKTKTPEKTEIELKKIVPKKDWNKINRIFVLWGKDCSGKSKEKFLEKIN